MWEEILNLAIKNGLWAVLFLALFVFVIKDSTKREKKYQETIANLTEHLGVVKMIKEDVDEIKSVVFNNDKTKLNLLQKNDGVAKSKSKKTYCKQNQKSGTVQNIAKK